ncbi:MAG: PH domain-containing protein [Sorangiineae bacterium]|nr:PH domain-containing protein [Polyangiaceae bacterium]MEB2322056.1 PH domain-containing protein [Sorangiineae bacterium]
MSQPAAEPEPEHTLFEGRPAVVAGLGALVLSVVTLGIALLVFWLKSRGKHYKLTSQRVVVERGILSKEMEQIDIYRITDYRVERPLSQRLMGTGNLVLEAIDSTTPTLRLDGLKTDVVALYERLRVAVEEAKVRRGVRVVDYGEPGMPIVS